jgi:exodeoxyribonuclease VII large subunit
MAVPVRAELLAQALQSGARMMNAVNRSLSQERSHLLAAVRGLPRPAELIEERSQRLDDRSERLTQAGHRLLDTRIAEVAQASAKLRSPAAQIDAKTQQLGSEIRALHAGWHRYSDRVREGISNGQAKLIELSRQSHKCLNALVERREHGLGSAGKLLESYSFRTVLNRGFALVRDTGGEPLMSAAEAQGAGNVSIEFADGKVGAVVDGKPAAPQTRPRKPSGSQGSLL